MAFFFGDGFDMYSQMSEATLGYWDGTSLNPNNTTITAGRLFPSRGIIISNSTVLDKVSGVNDVIHHINIAFKQTGAIGPTTLGVYTTFFDGATAQCSIVFRCDGAVLLTSGGPTGTVLATWSGAFSAPNTWYGYEFEVVINNVTGSFSARRNGNPVDDFAVTGLNTRPASVNNYANRIKLGAQAATINVVDDYLWRSGSTPWIGDVRCYTRYPAIDVTVALSRTSAVNNQVLYTQTGISSNLAANSAYHMRFIAAYSGTVTVTSINCNVSGGGSTGHVKMALFTSNGGAIGTVLATSDEVVAPGVGTLTATFSAPAHLTQGEEYWVGIIGDATVTFNAINSSSVPITLIVIGQTYSSWPTSNPGGTPSTTNIPGTLTIVYVPATNADAVGEAQQNAANYVYSQTVGQSDLYGIPPIGFTPASIIGVTTRGIFQKSDAGTRNATVQLQSGVTTVQGASIALNTSLGWISRTDVTDPNTGSAWTVSAVNNVTFGPIITA